MATARSFQQIDMKVPPTEPSHVVTKQHLDNAIANLGPGNEQGGGSAITTVLTVNAELELGKSYILNTTGDFTLPSIWPTGHSISIYCTAASARLVVGSNVISRIGAGNNLLLEARHTLTLTATAANTLEITRMERVGGSYTPQEEP